MRMSIRLLFVMLVALVGSRATAEDFYIHNPPTAVQINLSQSGVVAKFDLEIKRHFIYNFGIRFRYPRGNQVERSRIRAIIGGQDIDVSGRPLDPGVLTPIRLTILKKPDVSPLYQKQIAPMLTSWGGDAYDKGSDSFTKNIGHCDLLPGRYTVVLESLAHPEVYDSIPTFFLIGMDQFKVSFDPKQADRSKTCPM